MKVEFALCSLIVGFFVGGFTHKQLSHQYAPLVVRVVIPSPFYAPAPWWTPGPQISCHMEPGMDLSKVYCDHGVSIDVETRKPWVAPKVKHKPESDPYWTPDFCWHYPY